MRELPGGAREFVLEVRTLSFVRIDRRSRMQFGPTEVVIGCPFTVETEGTVHSLDPIRRGGLGPLAALYPDAVRWLWTTAEGELTAAFESGARLCVPPDPVLTAWSVGDVHCRRRGIH